MPTQFAVLGSFSFYELMCEMVGLLDFKMRAKLRANGRPGMAPGCEFLLLSKPAPLRIVKPWQGRIQIQSIDSRSDLVGLLPIVGAVIASFLYSFNKPHFFIKFIYFERESMNWGGAETEGERSPSRLCSASTEPNTRLKPTNRKIMT